MEVPGRRRVQTQSRFSQTVLECARHLLNNSLLLCQQAMELDLEARIAAVDPLELVVGKAAAKLRQLGGNFLEAPTIGARDLRASAGGSRCCSAHDAGTSGRSTIAQSATMPNDSPMGQSPAERAWRFTH
jgi:hypothetical protein